MPLRLALGVTDGVSLELLLEEPVSDGDVVMEALPGADSDTLPEAVPEAVSDGDGEAVWEAEIVCDPVGPLVAAVMGVRVAAGVRVAVAGVRVAELDARVRVAVGLCAAVSDASSAALSSTTARYRIPLNRRCVVHEPGRRRPWCDDHAPLSQAPESHRCELELPLPFCPPQAAAMTASSGGTVGAALWFLDCVHVCRSALKMQAAGKCLRCGCRVNVLVLMLVARRRLTNPLTRTERTITACRHGACSCACTPGPPPLLSGQSVARPHAPPSITTSPWASASGSPSGCACGCESLSQCR